MKKDITELPSDVQAQIRALEDLPDDQIDTTDAPEIIDWSDARRGVFLPACEAADYAEAGRGHYSRGSRPVLVMVADTRRTSMEHSASTSTGRPGLQGSRNCRGR